MSIERVTLRAAETSDPNSPSPRACSSDHRPRVEGTHSNDSHAVQTYLVDQSSINHASLSKAEAAPSATATFVPSDDDSPWAKKWVLCVDGGGIRGFSSLLLLKELMTRIQILEQKADPTTFASWNSSLIQPDRAGPKPAKFLTRAKEDAEFLPCHYFDYTAGTGSGGLIAIMLGRLRMSVDAVLDEYVQVYTQILSPRSLPGAKIVRFFKSPPYFTGSVSETSAFKPVQSSPNESDLAFNSDATRCRTIVCSVQRGAHKAFSVPYLYRSYPHHSSLSQPVRRAADFGTNPSIFSVVHATVAIPTPLKSIQLNASLNNASYEVYEEVEHIHGQSQGPFALFLSLGCGYLKSKSSRTKRAKGSNQETVRPNELEAHLHTVSNVIHELMLRESHQAFSYCRLDVKEKLDTVGWDDWKPKDSGEDTMRRIRIATEEYLQDPAVMKMMDRCANKLEKKRRERCETMRWEAFALGTDIDAR